MVNTLHRNLRQMGNLSTQSGKVLQLPSSLNSISYYKNWEFNKFVHMLCSMSFVTFFPDGLF